jgi:hypothetical protein
VHAPYRPGTAYSYLSGDVHGPVTYQCEGGGIIQALQLSCMQHPGDYSGYSGGQSNATPQPGSLPFSAFCLTSIPIPRHLAGPQMCSTGSLLIFMMFGFGHPP